MSRLWLASGSPRRRQLLTWAGFDIDVHPPDVDESHHPGEEPVAYARRLAQAKVLTAAPRRAAVAADTVVHRAGRLFGKPADRREGRAILAELSGRWHVVTTGVATRLGDRVHAFTVSTRVRFRTLTDAEITAYLASGEPDDKAGAYGIQGQGGSLVAEVQGSWTNVMGLPVEETLQALAELEVVPWA